MLKRNVEILKHGQHLAAEADLGVHQVLFDVDDREAFFARNAGDDIVRGILRRGGDDHRAAVGGGIGVLDVNRDPRKANREDRFLVQHGRAHVGKLAQLAVGDGLDRLRMVHDAGVCHEEARDIRPVLVNVGVDGAGHDGAGHVGAAARKGLDRPVRHGAVEAGDDGLLVVAQDGGERHVGAVRVKRAVILKIDHGRGVDEVEAEVIGENDAVQVFAAACRIVAAGLVHESALDAVVLLRHVQRQAEVGDNRLVALDDAVEIRVEFLAAHGLFKAVVEHIGDFGVVLCAFAGGGGHNISSGGVFADDLGHFAEVLRIGE